MVTNLSFALVLFEALHLLWVWNSVAERPIDGPQLGMGNRDDCTLTSASKLQSLVTRLEQRTLRSCPSPCRLGERGSQPPVARSCSPALSFAGTLMVTLDKPSPKMPDGDNREMALLDSCPFPSPLRW